MPVPSVKAQDHNATTAAVIEKTSSVPKNR